MLCVLCFSSLLGFGQKLQLEKASPFTAVKWENNLPIVQFDNEWYTLEKLDTHTTKEILDFCKQHFGVKWQKRFSEDLIEVLNEMGIQPNVKVKLLLNDGKQQKNVIGTFTLENRQKIWDYNKAETKTGNTKKLTISQAIEDVTAFQQILEQRSSYLQLTNYDYKSALHSLKGIIKSSKNKIDLNYLAHELAKIMAKLRDRHSSVKNEAFKTSDHPTSKLQLPFSIAPLNGKVLALKRINKEGIYSYLHEGYPYVKSINGLPIRVMIDSLVYKSNTAPKAAKFSRGVSEMQQLGRLYFMNNLKLPNSIEIVFTNGKTNKKEVVELLGEQFRYYSKLERDINLNSKDIEEGNLENMSKLLKGSIGYLSLPQMYHFEDVAGLNSYIDSMFVNFSNTKALIIDLRFNPGGGRDLIQKIASYIIPKSNSPWVANVAYLRTDTKGVTHKSMSSRYLYTSTAKKLNALDRKSISIFTKNFTTYRTFDPTKFSEPHFMILKSGQQHYTKPVYILVNEHSFSAASVFTSSFKGLPNIKIVGVTTDGSSGNSKVIYLKNSKIRVRVSTMLSFQRNGKTLDGNGTMPDLICTETIDQILKGEDVQLKKLIEIINQ